MGGSNAPKGQVPTAPLSTRRRWLQLTVLLLLSLGELWAILSDNGSLLNWIGLALFATLAFVVAKNIRHGQTNLDEHITPEMLLRSAADTTALVVAGAIALGLLVLGLFWLASIPSWAAVIVGLLATITVLLVRISSRIRKNP